MKPPDADQDVRGDTMGVEYRQAGLLRRRRSADVDRAPGPVGGGDRRRLVGAPRRSGQRHLHDADGPFVERRLAVAEVEVPHPHEALVEAHGVEGALVVVEVGPPAAQGLAVVQAVVVDGGDGEVGDPADRPDDGLHRGQAAAGEDERLDEVLRVLGPLVALGLDHDRLQGHQPVGAQEAPAVAEEGVVLAPVDGLDHLDGGELVVGAGEVAVVVVQHGDAVGQALAGDPLGGVGVLLGRDRGGGDPGAVVAGRVHGEAAPAGADLDDPLVGAQVEHAAEPVELLLGGVLERGVPGREDGRRVHHRGVEEVLEEVVAEVVVGPDVRAVAALVLAAEAAHGVGGRAGDPLDRTSAGGRCGGWPG